MNKKNKMFMRVLLVMALATALFSVFSLIGFASEAQVVEEEAAAQVAQAVGLANGLGYLAAALSVGIAGVGSGIAVAAAAPAAIGALTEDEKTFGKSIVFVALSEGMALYGMLISILILSNL